MNCKGKSLSEALLFAEHGGKHVVYKNCLECQKQHVLPRFELGIFMYGTCNSMNNLLSYCGLVNAKIRAFDKDLTVSLTKLFEFVYLLRTYVHHIKMFKSKQV